MPVDPGIIGPATLGIGQAVGAFTTFLPHISDIRKATPDTAPDVAADVRMGEIAAATLTVGVGVIVSSLTGSSVPAFVAAVTSLILICLFESVLRSSPYITSPNRNMLGAENA